MKRILSGIQPSGKIHLGNYFGAIKQQVEMQDSNYECFYFLANLHALTTVRDKDALKQNTLNLAMDYLAFGLDPEKITLFVQSEIPEHAELMWILSTICPPGLLDRAHAWKDAKAKKKKDPTIGLYTYPVLMSADILMYQPDLVPVGKDQKQHIEISRDLATKFNETFSADIFKLPEAMIKEDVATIPGIDGQKMSKSYGNTIEIFAEESQIKKTIMSIQTDSTPVEAPKDPKTCNIFKLYKLFATEIEKQNLYDKYTAGGMGYGEAKKILLEKYLAYFAEAREKRIALNSKMDYLMEVLNEGNKKASIQAKTVMDKVKSATGLKYYSK
jgi:tryptophanyl-tRNA synthetase